MTVRKTIDFRTRKPVNTKSLFDCIMQEGLKVSDVAAHCGMSEKQFMLCAERKKEFKASHVMILKKLLHLSDEELMNYCF